MDKVKTWNSEEGSEERKRKSRKRKKQSYLQNYCIFQILNFILYILYAYTVFYSQYNVVFIISWSTGLLNSYYNQK